MLWSWEGPLGTPLGLVQWKRASSTIEAGTSGFLSISDSDRRVHAELGQERQASSCVEAWNSACRWRCSRGYRPLFELYLEPAGFSGRCTGVSVPLRVATSSTGLRSKRCPGIGFLSRADREIGVFWKVSLPTRLRLEFPRETGLILRCDGEVGNPFQTKQGNGPSCRVQEERRGSEEVVSENLVSSQGDRYVKELCGSHQGFQVPFRTSSQNLGLLMRPHRGKGLHLAIEGNNVDFLELRRDSRVTSGKSGCLLCWPREVQSSVRVLRESWGLLSSHFSVNRPRLGLCPETIFPLQGRQGSRGCIPDSAGESGLVSSGSKELRSPLESRRVSLGAP